MKLEIILEIVVVVMVLMLFVGGKHLISNHKSKTSNIPECVDTYLLNDISCADKRAIIEFRKKQSAATFRQLHEDIYKLEREHLEMVFGLRDC